MYQLPTGGGQFQMYQVPPGYVPVLVPTQSGNLQQIVSMQPAATQPQQQQQQQSEMLQQVEQVSYQQQICVTDISQQPALQPQQQQEVVQQSVEALSQQQQQPTTFRRSCPKTKQLFLVKKVVKFYCCGAIGKVKNHLFLFPTYLIDR